MGRSSKPRRHPPRPSPGDRSPNFRQPNGSASAAAPPAQAPTPAPVAPTPPPAPTSPPNASAEPKSADEGYPTIDASFRQVSEAVGCGSKLGEQKKEDIFQSSYKDHVVTSSGKMMDGSRSEIRVAVVALFGSDFDVTLKPGQSAYDLEKGQPVTVKFVLRQQAGSLQRRQRRDYQVRDGNVVSFGDWPLNAFDEFASLSR